MNAENKIYPDSVRVVGDTKALFNERFSHEQNGLVYPRDVSGDFIQVAKHVIANFRESHPDCTQVTTASRSGAGSVVSDWGTIRSLLSSDSDHSVRQAIECIDEDIDLFHMAGYTCDIRFEQGHHGRANEPHFDGSGSSPLSRMLTCYTEPATLGWKKSDVVVSRQDLSLSFSDACTPFSMGVGPIWRIAVIGDMIEEDIDPLIHIRQESEEARAILIATKN